MADANEPAATPEKRTQGFALGLTSFYLSDALALVGYLALTPRLLAHLGHAEYGLLAIAGALMGYLGLLNLGVGPSLTRFVAAAHARGDMTRVRALVSAAVFLFLGVGALGFLIAVLSARHAVTWLKVPPEVVGVASTFLIIKGVQFAFALPLEAFAGANYGLSRIAEMNAIRMLGTVLELLSWGLVIWLGWGLVELGVLALSTALATGLLQRALLRRLLPDLVVSWRFVSRAGVWELVRYGLFFSLDATVVLLVFKTDELVIGAVLGVSAVALYAVLNQVIQSSLSLVVRISSTLYPSFSAMAARSERDGLRRIFQAATDGSLLVATGLCLLFVFFGVPATELWLGTQVPGAALLVLSFVIVAHTPVSVASKYIAAVGLLPRIAAVSVMEGVLNLTLSLLLIRPLGITGVALATLLAQLLTTTWFNPSLACRHLGLPLASFALGRLWRVSVACAPTVVVAEFMRRAVSLTTLSGVLLAVVVTTSVHATVSVLVFRRYVVGRRSP